MLMPGMLTDEQMAALDKARGPEFDRLFLTGMIRHHQGAIDMVDELFESYGAAQDETIFKFASDVYADQSTEIDRMQKMLAAPETAARLELDPYRLDPPARTRESSYEESSGPCWSLIARDGCGRRVRAEDIANVGAGRHRRPRRRLRRPRQRHRRALRLRRQRLLRRRRPQPRSRRRLRRPRRRRQLQAVEGAAAAHSAASAAAATGVMPPPVKPTVVGYRAEARPARRASSPAAGTRRRRRGTCGWSRRRRPPEKFLGVTNSDLAFTGKYAIQGNYNGFQVWDISNPRKPALVKAYLCPASQSDVSVYRNLLFVSAEGPDGRIDCGIAGRARAGQQGARCAASASSTSPTSRNPKYVANVQTCRGSHTHTVVDRSEATRTTSTSTSPARPACARPTSCPGCADGADRRSELARASASR